ncbi:MAG: triphosphoribosyl-dephospho-CoA synthase [Pseudomonadota bacterium]
MTAQSYQESYLHACQLELHALKPGNVGYHADGHGMKVQQFELSAEVSAKALFIEDTSVGEKILNAVQATHDHVGDNTNLGIILLIAPIVHALIEFSSHESLEGNLQQVLKDLTIDDAINCYRAINIAAPGGMGEVEDGDLSQVPKVTLLEAMNLAAKRDQIAQEYISNYHNILHHNLDVFINYLERWESAEWATTAVYLSQLLRHPDSLIIRKKGLLKAREISDMIAPLADQVLAASDPQRFKHELLSLDGQLKTTGINPGTTADITVATLFVAKLDLVKEGGQSE